MGFETYLVENVNEMHRLIVNLKVHSKEAESSLVEAAVIGCETLKRLVSDESFSRTLREMYDARLDQAGHPTREYRKIIEDSESLEQFLKVEYDILIKGGLYPDIASDLIRLCRSAFRELRDREKPVSVVIDSTKALSLQACWTAEELIERAKKSQGWEGVKERIKKILLGLGGAAMVGLDAVVILPTVATPVAPATVAIGAASAMCGGAIINNAATPSTATAAAH